MFGMGMSEMIIVLVIMLIFFGPKRLPGLAQSIGKSVRELKNALEGVTDEFKQTLQTPPVEAVHPPQPDVHAVSQTEAAAASEKNKLEEPASAQAAGPDQPRA